LPQLGEIFIEEVDAYRKNGTHHERWKNNLLKQFDELFDRQSRKSEVIHLSNSSSDPASPPHWIIFVRDNSVKTQTIYAREITREIIHGLDADWKGAVSERAAVAMEFLFLFALDQLPFSGSLGAAYELGRKSARESNRRFPDSFLEVNLDVEISSFLNQLTIHSVLNQKQLRYAVEGAALAGFARELARARAKDILKEDRDWVLQMGGTMIREMVREGAPTDLFYEAAQHFLEIYNPANIGPVLPRLLVCHRAA